MVGCIREITCPSPNLDSAFAGSNSIVTCHAIIGRLSAIDSLNSPLNTLLHQVQSTNLKFWCALSTLQLFIPANVSIRVKYRSAPRVDFLSFFRVSFRWLRYRFNWNFFSLLKTHPPRLAPYQLMILLRGDDWLQIRASSILNSRLSLHRWG